VIAPSLQDVSIHDRAVTTALRQIVEARRRRPDAQEPSTQEFVERSGGLEWVEQTTHLIGRELRTHHSDPVEGRDPPLRNDHEIMNLAKWTSPHRSARNLTHGCGKKREAGNTPPSH